MRHCPQESTCLDVDCREALAMTTTPIPEPAVLLLEEAHRRAVAEGRPAGVGVETWEDLLRAVEVMLAALRGEDG
jgi:hypothetical protein